MRVATSPGRGRPRRAFVLLLLSAFATASLASPGYADDAKPKPSAAAVAQARVHFERAVKLYGEDDFRAALIEFNRAYELAPNWSVLYNVGQSYYQLRDYPNALRTLEKYVAQGGASIPADRRAQVDHEIDELRGRVAHVTLASNAVGAEVSVDDVPIGQTPITLPQLVGAGRHTFRATKAGSPPATQIVDIAGGDNLTVTLTFADAARVVPLAPVVAAPPPPRPSYVPAIAALAVGGAGIVAGAVFGGLAVGNKSSLDGECQGKACPASAQGDIDAYARNGAVSTVAFVVGGAGLVAATVLFFVERGHEPPPPATGTSGAAGRGSATPWISATAGGVQGTF